MELTDAEARAVIGRHHEYYIQQWRGTGRPKFNRAAFWFSGAWLPFRRMYAAAVVFYVAVPALDLAANAVLGPPLNAQQFMGRGAACTVAAGLACGIWGNRWYRVHVARTIAKARARSLPDEEYLRWLRNVGGTSLAHAVGAILVMLGIAWGIDQLRL